MNWVSIGLDNGLSPDRRQAIIWTNARILLIGPLLEQTSMKLQSKYTFFIHKNAFENVVWEMAAILARGRWVNIPEHTSLDGDHPSQGASLLTAITVNNFLALIYSSHCNSLEVWVPVDESADTYPSNDYHGQEPWDRVPVLSCPAWPPGWRVLLRFLCMLWMVGRTGIATKCTIRVQLMYPNTIAQWPVCDVV